MASRLSIFEGGKGGDSSSALGRGGGVDVRGCGRATPPHGRAQKRVVRELCSVKCVRLVGGNFVQIEWCFHHRRVPI